MEEILKLSEQHGWRHYFYGATDETLEKMRREQITDRKAFYDHAAANRIFLEELVRQHPDMNVMCAKSVNTMRIITFNDHGKPEILWICLRVGNGHNDVDNFSSQGMAAKVDIQTGRVVGNALNGENEEWWDIHLSFEKQRVHRL